MSNKATEQPKKPKRVSPISGVAPPDGFEKYPERRHNGAWKKEDTARYKLEQMVKLPAAEVVEIANDPDAPLFERRIAKSLLKEEDWKTTESMINQVYGLPKAKTELDVSGDVKGVTVNVRTYEDGKD